MNLDEKQRLAAIQYHGRTKPPQKENHKMDFEVCIFSMTRGVLSPETYKLENVDGRLISKGDDTFTYRIIFDDELSLKEQLIVKIAPLEGIDDNTHSPTRKGRPESGFTFCVSESRSGDASVIPPKFTHQRCSSSVYGEGGGTKEIYFRVEDVNLAIPPTPRPRGEDYGNSVWHISVDEASMLADRYGGRFVPLENIHPNPAVDPGVPIEKRPQGDPRWYWYRQDCSNYDALKGKIGGTKWPKFIGMFANDGLENTFAGNHYSRFGRLTESKVCMAYLESNPSVSVHECGSFPHPTIEDVAVSPDGIIFNPEKTWKSLPKWYRTELEDWGKKKKIDPSKFDFSRGVLEIKTMHLMDKSMKGPEFKDYHMPQLYAEMICTGTWWGELIRYCAKTNECRMYRIYRKPGISERFEKCIKRVRSELIAGTPYRVAVDHQTCKDLAKECRTTATYYNTLPASKKPRYTVLPWPAKLMIEWEQERASLDIVANSKDKFKDPTIAAININATNKGKTAKQIKAEETANRKRERLQEQKRKRAEKKQKTISPGKKRGRGSTSIIKSIRTDPVDKSNRAKDSEKLWEDIQYTNTVIDKCIGNGDWAAINDESVLKKQVLRLMELEKQIGIQLEEEQMHAKKSKIVANTIIQPPIDEDIVLME